VQNPVQLRLQRKCEVCTLSDKMKLKTATDFYGTEAKISQVLGISRQSVAKWRLTGLVPRGAAFELQVKSGNRLQAEEADYENPVFAAHMPTGLGVAVPGGTGRPAALRSQRTARARGPRP
jgi:biotin operon repressor